MTTNTKKLDWNSATTKKHIKEAKAVGLTLIGEGRSRQYRIYHFNDCGHEQEIHTTCVRNNNLRCHECLQKKLESEAKAVGLTLIGEGKNNAFRTYRFNKCKHEQEITMANVRSNTFRCRECLQIQLETEAKVAGLTLLGLGRNSKDRTYRFNKCKHEQLIQMNDVRIDKFRCNQCFQMKLEDEAKVAGLTLLGPGRHFSNRTYRFNKCKHEQVIQKTTVRNGGGKCQKCLQIKLESEAKAVGLTLIGEGRNAIYRRYRFNKCKHEQEITMAHVRSNTFRCHECLQKKLESEAKAVGLTLIGEGRNAIYRRYRFNKCKHEQEIRTGKVRSNTFRCRECLQIQLETEAEAVDLTLLGPGRNKNYRTYRFNKCKHEQEIRTGGVRNSSFICNTCEETSRDLPSKVYLLKIQSGSFIWLKLGYAKQTSFRIKQYRLPEDVKVRRLKVIDFDTGREAHKYESSLHKKYIRKRLPVKKMKKYHKFGFNECYPLEMLDTLIGELESKSTQ